MSITSSHWSQIVSAFKEGSNHSILHISKTEKGAYTFSVNELPTHSSVRLFEELIGEIRLNRICQQMNIDKSSPSSLTKKNVHKIFIGMMDIKKEDITDEFDKSYKQLMLFNNFKEFEKAFIFGSPNIDALRVDKAATSGKGLKGLTERISILAEHYFTTIAETNEKAKIYRDAEMLTSRLADREIKKNAVLYLHDGYFYVDEVFVGGGAYVAVLRDLNNQKPPKIVCRGTAMRKNATGGWQSGINDVLVEIGTMGVKNIWPNLSQYLKHNHIHTVEILGKSLGGAHAQELAVLVEGVLKIKVEKLTTYCSVGVGQKINTFFKNEILTKRSTPFNIEVIRNGGAGSDDEVDYIPTVGGEHLGAEAGDKCTIEVTYISTDQQVEICRLESTLLHLIKRFISSFGVPHCRQTTLKNFYWRKIENKDDVEKHLKIGNRLEKIRMIIAWIINLLTLFLLNGKSFQSYYFAKVREEKGIEVES
jgi:hypothetical protein